ncbi:MAG TPA: cation:proton antiporter, partial [Solirubrobacteraceae bacterium]|nr:cation:proton antiporter [Solirubrobacteraceae bacterium]
MAEGYEILVVGALLAAGLIASLLAERMRVPALLLFLFVGMVLGSDATGLIAFSNYHLAQEIGVVALALILFEGGLTSGLLEIRPVLASAVSLAVVGTAVTAIVVGLAAVWLLDLSTIDGLLVGAIVSATDGAAIFGLLRSSSLRRRLARTLEGESGFNDPMAILLVLGFIALAQEPGFGALDFVELFVRQIGIGLVVGTGLGLLAVRALGRMRLASTGLYPVASLCLAALAFGAADALDGSGFLAVYLAGLILGTASV